MSKTLNIQSSECCLAVLVALSIGYKMSEIAVLHDKVEVCNTGDVQGRAWDPVNDISIWAPLLLRYELSVIPGMYRPYIDIRMYNLNLQELQFDRRRYSFVQHMLTILVENLGGVAITQALIADYSNAKLLKQFCLGLNYHE